MTHTNLYIHLDEQLDDVRLSADCDYIRLGGDISLHLHQASPALLHHLAGLLHHAARHKMRTAGRIGPQGVAS